MIVGKRIKAILIAALIILIATAAITFESAKKPANAPELAVATSSSK